MKCNAVVMWLCVSKQALSLVLEYSEGNFARFVVWISQILPVDLKMYTHGFTTEDDISPVLSTEKVA